MVKIDRRVKARAADHTSVCEDEILGGGVEDVDNRGPRLDAVEAVYEARGAPEPRCSTADTLLLWTFWRVMNTEVEIGAVAVSCNVLTRLVSWQNLR